MAEKGKCVTAEMVESALCPKLVAGPEGEGQVFMLDESQASAPFLQWKLLIQGVV